MAPTLVPVGEYVFVESDGLNSCPMTFKVLVLGATATMLGALVFDGVPNGFGFGVEAVGAASTDSMPPILERAAPAPVAAIALSMSRRAIRVIRILLVVAWKGRAVAI